jgi:hypothetical protein
VGNHRNPILENLGLNRIGLVMLKERTIKEWCIKFLLINLKEVGQEVDQNSDGQTVCIVIKHSAISETENRGQKIEKSG